MASPTTLTPRRAISMTIYYLYIKTHNITGLKYLGQTTQDPYQYNGSGVDWTTHLRDFGDKITTTILLSSECRGERNYWGRYYSNLFKVTTAMDDYGNRIWANRIPETGGGPGGSIGHASSTKGKTYEEIYGEEKAEELKQIIRKSNSNRVVTEETCSKIAKSMTGKMSGDKHPMFNKTHSEKTKKIFSEQRVKWDNGSREKMMNTLSSGTFVTPWGMFVSASLAVKHPESEFTYPGTIREYCITKNDRIIRTQKKTPKELGYGFIPK